MGRLAGKTGNVAVGLATLFSDGSFDEQVLSNVTATEDITDSRVGNSSGKFAVGVNFTTGIIGSKAIASTNLTTYNYLMMWVKSSVALAANDWTFDTDETALLASSQSNNLPALTANLWTYIKLAPDMSGANYDAVISIGFKQAVDKGAMNFWADHIQAAKTITGIKNWSLDYKMNVQDVTGFDSGGAKAFATTITEWAGSFDGFKDGAPLAIGTVVGLNLQESATATQQAQGTAIITNWSDKTDVAGIVTYTYSFQGTGELSLPTA